MRDRLVCMNQVVDGVGCDDVVFSWRVERAGVLRYLLVHASEGDDVGFELDARVVVVEARVEPSNGLSERVSAIDMRDGPIGVVIFNDLLGRCSGVRLGAGQLLSVMLRREVAADVSVIPMVEWVE